MFTDMSLQDSSHATDLIGPPEVFFDSDATRESTNTGAFATIKTKVLGPLPPSSEIELGNTSAAPPGVHAASPLGHVGRTIRPVLRGTLWPSGHSQHIADEHFDDAEQIRANSKANSQSTGAMLIVMV